MKNIVFVAIFLILLLSAWSLYLYYGNKKFEESLPELPQRNAVTQTKDATTLDDQERITFEPSDTVDMPEYLSDSVDENKNRQMDREVTSLPENALQPEFSETLELDEIEFADFPEIPQQPPGMSLRDWLNNLSSEDLELVYIEKPWLKPVSEMTHEERVREVNRRHQQLIDQYGNIPEVAVFNKYVTVDSLMGGSQIIDPEDIVMHAKALSFMWPTPENTKHYQQMKNAAENGWHIEPSGY